MTGCWQGSKMKKSFNFSSALLQGVPQGSALGAILINIYLNDLFIYLFIYLLVVHVILQKTPHLMFAIRI